MDPNDEYFTHTIVGAPMTAFLGRRHPAPRSSASGLQINLSDGRTRLSTAWGEWVLVRHLDELNGVPRRRPGRARRWIERYCLLLGGGGLALAAFAVAWSIAAA